MRRIILKEVSLFKKFLELVRNQTSLQVVEVDKGYQINSQRKLWDWRNKLLSPILFYANSCYIKVEQLEEGIKVDYNLSFLRLKIFYLMLGFLISIVFIIVNRSYAGPLIVIGILVINYFIMKNITIRKFEDLLL